MSIADMINMADDAFSDAIEYCNSDEGLVTPERKAIASQKFAHAALMAHAAESRLEYEALKQKNKAK